MFGFQVLNTVVASSVFFFFSQFFAQSRHSWYAYGPVIILNPDSPSPSELATHPLPHTASQLEHPSRRERHRPTEPQLNTLPSNH